MKPRSMLVEDLAHSLDQQVDELAEQMARTLGKPIRFGRVEVRRTVAMLGLLCQRFGNFAGEPRHPSPAIVRRRPHGLIAVITPWNNPIYLSLGKIVPAILLGNTVAWKPAPQARSVSRRIMACLKEAGWPDSWVTLVEGDGRAAEELMNRRAVAAVTLTGSTAAGASAQAICGRRHIPLQAELGGNNAAIVWSDADLAEAARQVAAGAFDMAGQRCTANRRVIVLESDREHFLRLLTRATTELPWGDPLGEETRIGPLVSAVQRARIAATVDRAVAAGQPILWPLGQQPAEALDAAWYSPTIITCDDPAHEIVQEETFGPVLVVQTARDWEHAIRLCNGVRQGLAAAIFTASPDIVGRFLEEAEAGILKVNQSTADAAVDVPFGGWKASGLGPPEHGDFDVEFYTRPQTVYRSVPA